MKNNIREKLSSLLILLGGVIIMLTVSGFSSAFHIVKENDSLQTATDPQSREVPLLSETIADTIPGIDWEEIKKEIEAAKAEALEVIDWQEIKKEIEAAKSEALEGIDWEEIKKEMAKTRVTIDSILQNLDFDFDVEPSEENEVEL